MSEQHAYVIDTAEILPDYVQRLPFVVKIGWLKVFNVASDLYGTDMAVKMANKWALNKIESLKDSDPDPEEDKVIETVAQSKEATDMVHMTLTSKNEDMIAYGEDGEIVLEAILADDHFSSDNKRFSKEALISMADKINQNGLALPDIEHKEYNRIMSESKNMDDFKTQLQQSKGLFKKISAYYESGKLYIKAWLDKRYKNHINKYKSLSIEAKGVYNVEDPSVYVDAEPFSFTFTNTPKLANANIISVE